MGAGRGIQALAACTCHPFVYTPRGRVPVYVHRHVIVTLPRRQHTRYEESVGAVGAYCIGVRLRVGKGCVHALQEPEFFGSC